MFGWHLDRELVSSGMVKTVNIAGAGIGGLTAAIALARRGISVAVYEQTAALSEVGAGLQLSPNAMQILRNLGLEDPLREFAFEPESAVIKDGTTSRTYVSVPVKDASETKFGAPYFHVHRADLHRVLCAESAHLGVSFQLGTRLENFSNSGFIGVPVADVSIAADGVRSAYAEAICPNQPARFTGQVAWRGTVPAGRLSEGLIPPDATVWTGVGKHLVTYYVRGGAILNFVVAEERDNWIDSDWNKAGDIDLLRSSFKDWHPTIVTLLEAAQEANIWALYDKPVLDRWSAGSVVLLGDACHPTLPFIAQGAAMAIEDAYVLAACLDGVNDVPRALKRYEMLRKPRTSMLQAKARKNADMFHYRGPLDGLLSKAKLQTARCLPSRLVMKQFDGIYAYDAPAIMG